MAQMLRVRSVVLGLIEKARLNKYAFPSDLLFENLKFATLGKRQLKSSLEAEVDIVIPNDDAEASQVFELLQREGGMWSFFIMKCIS
jgi:hypothetical protein